ncbi:MAG TPA: tripartite tricarboxylate transporter substrate-binding protein [Casimicrobiaceae bacterium]
MRLLKLAVLVCAAIAWPVHADEWPSKPVRLIVPFPPGGSTDVAARVVADKLSKALGQRFIVENRGGAGGVVGTTDVARAEPDGYTILFAANQVSTMHLVVKASSTTSCTTSCRSRRSPRSRTRSPCTPPSASRTCPA